MLNLCILGQIKVEVKCNTALSQYFVEKIAMTISERAQWHISVLR